MNRQLTKALHKLDAAVKAYTAAPPFRIFYRNAVVQPWSMVEGLDFDDYLEARQAATASPFSNVQVQDSNGLVLYQELNRWG